MFAVAVVDRPRILVRGEEDIAPRPPTASFTVTGPPSGSSRATLNVGAQVGVVRRIVLGRHVGGAFVYSDLHAGKAEAKEDGLAPVKAPAIQRVRQSGDPYDHGVHGVVPAGSRPRDCRIRVARIQQGGSVRVRGQAIAA